MTYAAFSDRWRAREDAKIHRCTCGAWIYAGNPCSACGPQNTSVQDEFPQVINGARPQIPQACAQRHREDSVPIPRLRTGPVHGALYPAATKAHAGGDAVGSDGGMAHAAPSDHHDERRTA